MVHSLPSGSNIFFEWFPFICTLLNAPLCSCGGALFASLHRAFFFLSGISDLSLFSPREPPLHHMTTMVITLVVSSSTVRDTGNCLFISNNAFSQVRVTRVWNRRVSVLSISFCTRSNSANDPDDFS